MSIPTTSAEIYKSFSTFLEEHSRIEESQYIKRYRKHAFYDKIVKKGFFLYELPDGSYMIGFSLRCCEFTIDKHFELLMTKRCKLIDAFEKIMFARTDDYAAMYLQSKTLLIDILKYLSIDHPTHCVFLIDTFQGWSELKDELDYHETCFLGKARDASFKLHDIPECSTLLISLRDLICSDLTGLQDTTFGTIKIHYSSSAKILVDDKIIPFGPLQLKYHSVEIFDESLDSWDKCFEQGLIPHEFIRKIRSIQMYDRISPLGYSAFLSDVSCYASLKHLKCELKIQIPEDLFILKSILTSKHLKKVEVYIDSFDLDSRIPIDISVSDSIEHLDLIETPGASTPLILLFSSLSGLKHIKTTFHVEFDKQLFSQFTYVCAFDDETISSFSEILDVEVKDLAYTLCTYEDIDAFEIRYRKYKVHKPKSDTKIGPIECEFSSSSSSRGIQRFYQHIRCSKIRTKSLEYYSK